MATLHLITLQMKPKYKLWLEDDKDNNNTTIVLIKNQTSPTPAPTISKYLDDPGM